MYRMIFDKYVNGEKLGRYNFKIDFELDGIEQENIEECLNYYYDCKNYDYDFNEKTNKDVICDFCGNEIELKNIELVEV